MQVTEIAREGLWRDYAVALPGPEIAAERDARLAEIAATAAMPGFRAGRVPPELVRERYGAAVLAEVLERRVSAGVRDVLAQLGVAPALPPRIEVVSFAEDGDLAFRMAFEALPEIPLPDFAGITIERLAATPSEDAVHAAVAALATRHGELEDVPPRPAAPGEVLVCDHVGRLPADLLANGPALGARAGRPGSAPTRWSLDASAGLERAILLAGEEAAMPFFDLAVKGSTAAPGFIRVFPGLAAGIPATPGQVMTFTLRLRILDGALPEAATVRLGFNERSEMTILTASRVVVTPGEAEAVATIELTGDPALRVVRPLLEIGLPRDTAVDVVLRIGPARVFVGASEPAVPPFDGGSAQDAAIEVGTGAGAIHPGLAAGLAGLAPGERREIDVVFPFEHPARELAGQRARFSVQAKALKVRRPLAVGDGMAQALGSADIGALADRVRRTLQRDCDLRSRFLLKRALLDALAERAGFAVPEGLVAAEFEAIWLQVQAERSAGRADPADEGRDEASLRARYRELAARRVRLRLLLTEIGRVHAVEVPAEEMARAIRQEAARYPGQERQVIEFYGRDAEAAAGLRAPLLEERIVDFVLARARVTQRAVTARELLGAG